MSTAPKFTPGPWRMDVEGASYAYEVVHTSPRGLRRVVARVASKSGLREADARLIAAAPELYAVLVEMADNIDGQIETAGDLEAEWSKADRVLVAKARAALAKASA